MAITEFKTALRKDPTLAQKNPSDIAKQFHLTDQEKREVEGLYKQCMGLKGTELEERVSKGFFGWDD